MNKLIIIALIILIILLFILFFDRDEIVAGYIRERVILPIEEKIKERREVIEEEIEERMEETEKRLMERILGWIPFIN